MKLYIASNFESRDRVRPIRDRVWAMGHEVTSTWLDEVARPASLSQEEFYRRLAIKDLCEISAAELVIVDTIEVTPRGGRENEYGFALGRYQKCLIWIVGPARSVFHQLADNRFDTWEEALSFLQFGYEDRANREQSDPSNLAQPTDGSQARFREVEVRLDPRSSTRADSGSLHYRGEEVRRPQLAGRPGVAQSVPGVDVTRAEVVERPDSRPRGWTTPPGERGLVRYDPDGVPEDWEWRGRPSEGSNGLTASQVILNRERFDEET